jgi:hypothetical protein
MRCDVCGHDAWQHAVEEYFDALFGHDYLFFECLEAPCECKGFEYPDRT